LLKEHRTEHNDVRPHSSQDYKTPNAFFEGWLMRKRNQIIETLYNPGLSSRWSPRTRLKPDLCVAKPSPQLCTGSGSAP